jgi:cell division protein FtsX
LFPLLVPKKSFSNLREWWDIAKIKIKSITIEASLKVNTTDDKIKALENKLETLKDISEPSRQQLEELAQIHYPGTRPSSDIAYV